MPAYQLNEGLTSEYFKKHIPNPIGEGMHNLEPGYEILQTTNVWGLAYHQAASQKCVNIG